jgi:energy-coupling factor transport system ATP-binding protein
MPSEKPPILKFQNLGVTYKKSNKKVFSGLNFDIFAGEVILLYGPNGSGKSTFLRTVLQLHPKNSIESTGSIMLQSGCTLGYVHQRPNSQILTFSVEEELATPLSFKNIERKIRIQRITEIVNTHKWHDKLKKDPRKLSAGQQQVLNLMVNEVSNASIYCLDEPLSLLDNDNSNLVVEILNFMKNSDKVVFISSHNVKPLMSLIDRVIVFESDSASIINMTQFEEVYYKINTIDNIKFLDNNNTGLELINLKNLKIGYDDPLKYIDSYSFLTGHIYIITGKNGSGKTTLIRTILKEIKPLDGQVKYEKRLDLFYVPQDPYSFFWRASVLAEWNYYVDEPYKLEYNPNTSPFLLSEGELKQLSLTIALASDAQVLMFDEPTYALDYKSIHWFLEQLSLSTDKIVILSSNDTNILQLKGFNHLNLDEVD